MRFANRPGARHVWTGIAIVALTATAPAFAVGTDAGTPIDNVATVEYQVNTVPQTVIESSPTGNSTPGVGNGTDTSFLVDNRIDFTLVEEGGIATPVSPGETGVVTTFRLTNTGNAPQDFALTANNLAAGTVVFGGDADNQEMNALQAFADTNGDGVYSPGTDEAFVDSLTNDPGTTAANEILVFIVGTVPPDAIDGQFANVSLTAQAATAGSSGADIATETTGGNTALVDIVFGDAGEDNSETAEDSYAIASAALTVTKAAAIISDPFNGTTDPLYVPGAIVEYTITVTNGGTSSAEQVNVSDTLTAELALALGEYPAGADVEYDLGGATTGCSAAADADACALAGNVLSVAPAATLATGESLVVRFRVTIQ